MTNPHLQDFSNLLHTRFSLDSTSMSYSDWILKNTTLSKKKFTFEGYEFQTQIVDDMHPNLAVIKCSQIGLSEIQIRKFAAFLARENGTKAIFTLPTDQMAQRISQTRIQPIIAHDKVFNMSSEKVIRRTELIQINQSFGYIAGNKESDATSIDADALFHDEVDLSEREILALYQSRLQGSDWRITQNFSTPTFEGVGIDALYTASDQHEYLIRCPHCRHHNKPEWSLKHIHFGGITSDINSIYDIDEDLESRINYDRSFVFCSKCKKPLDRTDPELRSWVARFAGRRTRGYRIHPFGVPRLTVEYIMGQQQKYLRNDARRRFSNTVLGEAYNDEKARLSEVAIRNVMTNPGKPEISPDTPVVIGIDVGLVCHLTLRTVTEPKEIVFHWETLPEYQLKERVKQIMATYNVVGGCIDRYPYTPLSNEIRDITDGIIMPVAYLTTQGASLTIAKDELGAFSYAQAPRTAATDAISEEIRKSYVEFSGYGTNDHTIVEHLRNMVRIEKEDKVIWEKVGDTDHFFHSLIYSKLAIRLHGLKAALNNNETRSLVLTQLYTAQPQFGDTMGMTKKKTTPISHMNSSL